MIFYAYYKKSSAKLAFIKSLIFSGSFLLYNSLCFATNPAISSPAEVTKVQTPNQLIQAEVEQKAQDVVWQIVNSKGYGGSAFAIKPKLFITNFHVVQALFTDPSQDIKLLHSSGRSLSFKKIIKVDSRMDLALIETHEKTKHYLTIPRSREFFGEDQSMEDLLIIGYNKMGLTKFEQIGKAKKFPYSWTFAINTSDGYGVSGSPVFNNKGLLVGVVFYGHLNLVTIRRMQYVSEFIHQDLNSLNCSTISSIVCIQTEIERLQILATQDSDSLAQFAISEKYFFGAGVKKIIKKLSTGYNNQQDRVMFWLKFYWQQSIIMVKTFHKIMNGPFIGLNRLPI